MYNNYPNANLIKKAVKENYHSIILYCGGKSLILHVNNH